MLGGFSVRCGDIDKDAFPDRSSRLLFVCLALRPHFGFAKDELALILWPGIASARGGVSKAAAKTGHERLIRALSNLKLHLTLPGLEPAPPFIDADETVRLNAGAFDIDAAQFESYVASGRWTVAAAACRGALLPSLSGPFVAVGAAVINPWQT